MARERRFSAEVRERAVRMVQEPEASHPSRWAAVKSIAGKIGFSPETLRKWLRRAEIDQGKRPGTTSADQSRIKDLEREFRELKRANEFLRKASAFFAQAEFDRRGK